ncbi:MULTISPECIES: ornithine cyclodeaminase family protein [Roseobacteraceae]|uniref:Delta(1)-pyrroline-2-carboxylate reductase n=1 Tax=Pseudosulfitobacter pseudonitzschiae TaxID=1402135 RepID=A0A221K820_9RHOB|nr:MULTISPECIES: ornithine cyclodeaminase [Roseobacteraceae]ASM75030.1 delta(1)-pyrroline-2-carboxylate reductase [Pseudosulfitobacter pseudonitzschiae]
MITPRTIKYEDAAPLVTWPEAVAALREGHALPKAQVGDIFLGPSEGSLLSRGAFIEGLGFGVKSVTVFGANPAAGLPTIQGAMFMFEPEHGQLAAIIDSRIVTELKTAVDSVLGATYLARPDCETLLIVGAGTVARSLIDAYTAVFPSIRTINIWARRTEQAEALTNAVTLPGIEISAVADLPTAAAKADIISAATMAREPVLNAEWITPGTHVDLIGAFKADMREADDALISSASLFVDSRDTTIHHIGELMILIANGVITEEAVRGDFYDLVSGSAKGRQSVDEITLFKNGGGAHLDLMTASYIAEKVTRAE